MSITIKHLLKQITHNEMTCVAGENGLDARIENVTVIDSPEILNWLRGGELVVSTGYVSYNNTAILNGLIAGLKEKGAVGLGIKVNRYYRDVPEILIEEGNRLGFPVFAISYEMRMSDIMKLVYANFFTDSMSKIEKENLLYQQVTKAILSGENMDAAVFNISLAFRNPVVLLDESFNLLSFENHEDNRIAVEDYLNLSGVEAVFTKFDCQNLIDYYNENQFRLHRISISNGEGNINVMISPVAIDKNLKGFLGVVETIHEVPKEEYTILENSAGVLAIYLLQKELQNENRRFTQEGFLTNVLMNHNTTDEMIQQYCDVWNFDFTKKRICMFFEMEGFQRLTFYKRKEITESFERAVKQTTYENKCLEYVIPFRDGFIVYHLYSEEHTDRLIRENTEIAVERILGVLLKMEIPIKISVSATGRSLHHISESFRQVIEGIRLGRIIFPEKNVYYYGDMMIYDLLGNAISLDHLLSIYNNTVVELDVFDRENNTDFLQTLEAFLENNCNTSKAAQKLHLHRNTMMCRVERIEDILQVDLKVPEVIFNLRLGIRAKKILQSYHQ